MLMVLDLSASVSSKGVPLLTQPLHDGHALRDPLQSVEGEQQVGDHLDVCRARLPG